MLKKLQPYNKLLVALLGAVLTVIVQFYGGNQYVQIVVTLLSAAGVYAAPNKKATN